ncbi:trihelix transcription factor PTL [Brassica rapa]|uniref:Myb-like domain-containing protein n=2 Tax=Brassica campestris TaxID=3711 RepID=M4CNI9_BRACM|nr:trihelix transcription factor PTL [Brassica rapa]
MEDHHTQYGIPELRQLMKGEGRTTTTASPSTSHFPSDFFGFNLAPAAPPPPPQHHRLHQFTINQEMGFLPHGIHGLGGGSSTAGNNSNLNMSTSGGGVGFSGFLDGGGLGGSGGTGRWPRQETLTLLEIRSRLDHKFKEANQKGPFWDEVSRIMSEEYGYQRSGKKCREKFENLYKYYKKTKEGKAGRQDGKHYRFFRQLEALYGDSNNLVSFPNHNTQFMSHALGFHTQNAMNITATTSNIHDVDSAHGLLHHQSLSISNNYNSSELELMTSSSEGNDSDSRRKKRSWKAKIKEFIDVNMKRLIERQDIWLEKLTKVIEDKEEQRMMKEEEWRKSEAARVEQVHLFWAKERERMEARDVAVLEALQYLAGKTLIKPSCSSPEERINGNNEIQNNSENVSLEGSGSCWNEQEIIKLMEIRTSMDTAFQEILGECSDEFLWEEVSAKLIQLGFDHKSALSCKEKWECISNGMRKEKKQISKKRKDNSSSCGVYYPRTEENAIYNNQESGYDDNDQHHHQMNEQDNVVSSTSNAAAGDLRGAMAASTNCFPFVMGDGDQNLWESYSLRLSKGENQ